VANSIEKDMYTLVQTLTDVTAVVSTRVYWIDAPEGDLTYPYITYFTVSANGELIYIGKRTADALVQFSVWDTVAARGLDVANDLFDGLSAYHGTPGDKVIQYISCNGPNGMRDPDYDNVYQYVVTAEVRYER